MILVENIYVIVGVKGGGDMMNISIPSVVLSLATRRSPTTSEI